MTLLIKKLLKRIKEIHKQFNKILFIFYIIQYIKTNLLEKTIFSEKDRKNISNVYHFDYNLKIHKKGYDYLFLGCYGLNQNVDKIFKINVTSK